MLPPTVIVKIVPFEIASNGKSRSIELLSKSLTSIDVTKLPIEPLFVSNSPFEGGEPAPQR